MAMLRNVFGDNRGVGAIEYALIASLISIAALTSFSALGSQVNGQFTSVDQKVSNVL